VGQIWWIFILRGVLAAALGIFALIWPTLTLSILVLFVGAYLIADGVMGLVLASRRSASPGRLLLPVVSAVIGLLLVLWPSESARTLFVVLGAAALFIGISYIVTARRYGLDDMDRGLMSTAGAVAIVVGVVLIVWRLAGSGGRHPVLGDRHRGAADGRRAVLPGDALQADAGAIGRDTAARPGRSGRAPI
jgi:uncharacterized membrane protein HdeD (DUF308 family)